MRKFNRLVLVLVFIILCLFLAISVKYEKNSLLAALAAQDPLTGSDNELPQSNVQNQNQPLPELDQNTLQELKLKAQMNEIESENSRRLDKIETVCRKYGLGMYRNSENPTKLKHPPTPQYQVFFFDRANKWSLCPIYKAGSTSWLFNMLLLAGLSEEEINSSDKTLSELAREQYPELDPTAAEQEFQITTKVMTVRHPFERVLSAYRDKLENVNHGWEHGTKHFYKAYGEKIVKKYRPGGNSTSSYTILEEDQVLRDPNIPKPAGVEPTFQEFVRYLIDSDLVSKSDDHWIPYYLYCTPCLLQYEFIAKTETLGADQTYVIKALGLSDKIKPRWKHKTQFTENHTEVSAVAETYFRQLTTVQILQLYKTYLIDFELFGYDFIPYLKYARDSSR